MDCGNRDVNFELFIFSLKMNLNNEVSTSIGQYILLYILLFHHENYFILQYFRICLATIESMTDEIS